MSLCQNGGVFGLAAAPEVIEDVFDAVASVFELSVEGFRSDDGNDPAGSLTGTSGSKPGSVQVFVLDELS